MAQAQATKSAAWSARNRPESLTSPLLPISPYNAHVFDDVTELPPSLRGSARHPTPPTAFPSSPLAKDPATAIPVWKKGLYERQPFEDNYVDPVLFLQELKKNENLREYVYSDVVKDTFVIVQQISFVVVFVYMFASIVSSRVELSTVILIDLATLVVGAACFLMLRHELDAAPLPLASVFAFGQQTLLFTCVVLLMSPVFQTLTVTYTDDTIWALAIMAMFVHLLFTDYNYLNATGTKYVQGVGVNAATFGSILMTSRIRSPTFGAALIGFGILCFNLSPIPRHYLKAYSMIAHVGATFLLCGVTMGCLLQVPLLAALFAFFVVVICFLVPWCFVQVQALYKNQISGPWDEAKPQNSLAAAEWANAGLLS